MLEEARLALRLDVVCGCGCAATALYLTQASNFAVKHQVAYWHGLTMNEAKKKQSILETLAAKAAEEPDKAKFRRELLEQLRSGEIEDDGLVMEDPAETPGLLGGFKNLLNKR